MKKVWGAHRPAASTRPRRPLRVVAGVAAAILGLGTMGVGLMSSASATDDTTSKVCPDGGEWDKTDLNGDPMSYTVTAPSGYLITAVCAKSADFLPLFTLTLSPPVASYTFTSAAAGFDKHALSHVSGKLVKIEASESPTPTPTTATPTTATPTTATPTTTTPTVSPSESTSTSTPTETTTPTVSPSESTSTVTPTETVTVTETPTTTPTAAPSESIATPTTKVDTQPTVKGVEAQAPGSVPTSVDAGLGPVGEDSGRNVALMALGLLLAVAGAALGFAPAPRRGRFQH